LVVGCLGLFLVGCETDTDDGDEGDDRSAGGGPYGKTENHVIRGGYDEIQSFLWKTQTTSDVGPRVVTRWPSDLYWFYRCTPTNTYVMVGDVRLEYYTMDRDNFGRKLSYQKLGITGNDFPPGVKAVLYRDGKPFAFVDIANPSANLLTRLPNQTGALGDNGYAAKAVSDNPDISAGSIEVQGFRYKIQEDGSPNHSGNIPRAKVGWPTDLANRYGVTQENSYVIFGKMLMELYQFDPDNGGNKPTFGAHPWSASDFPPNTTCTLYKDGKPFASINIPDAHVEFQTFLP